MPKAKVWQRLRIVGNSLLGDLVISKNNVDSVGSSSSLRRALAVLLFMASAGSIRITRIPWRCVPTLTKAFRARTCSMTIWRLGFFFFPAGAAGSAGSASSPGPSSASLSGTIRR
ncbi:MAG: hypothetical protein MZW92_26585 [Comamonadaceae bacterium]|nr:hypothetical protein [Comamonadaceae bacterium]